MDLSNFSLASLLFCSSAIFRSSTILAIRELMRQLPSQEEAQNVNKYLPEEGG